MAIFFFSPEILTYTTVLGLIEKGLLFPGKLLVLWLGFVLFGS